MNEEVEIPRILSEMQEEMQKAKKLIQRMDKGQKIIKASVNNREIVRATEAVALFAELADELNNHLEHALFMHEALLTKRTTVVTRSGQVVNSIQYPVDEMVIVDLFVCESIKKLKEVFGEEIGNFVELVKN